LRLGSVARYFSTIKALMAVLKARRQGRWDDWFEPRTVEHGERADSDQTGFNKLVDRITRNSTLRMPRSGHE
jgi:hypothetical protein